MIGDQLLLVLGFLGNVISMLYILNPTPGIEKQFNDKNGHHDHPHTRCPEFTCTFVCHDTFSATRNVVLLAMRLSDISACVGRNPFLVRIRIWDIF